MSALEQAVWNRAELQSQRYEFLATASELDDSDLNFRPEISGNAQLGASDGSDSSANAVGILSVNYSQLLNDYGRGDIQKEQAWLELEAQQTAYALAADQIFADVARAMIQNQAAGQKIAIIDRQLGQFREREAQIQQAAAVGVLTNVDLLDIRNSENQIKVTRSLAVAEQAQSRVVLDRVLQTAAAQTAASRGVGAITQTRLDRLPQWRRVRAELLVDQSDATVNNILSSLRPRLSLQSQVSVPFDPDEDSELFVGVRWDFTLYDGGRAAQRAQSQRIRSQSLAQEVEVFDQLVTEGRASLGATLQGIRLQRAALRDQITIRAEGITQLEQLLSVGRADVSTLAQEILAQATTELSLVDLTAQSKLNIVSYAQTVGGTCEIFKACENLHLQWRVVPDASL
nr:TolC family protein [Octadecabacter dasysiphoniae]